MGWYFLLWPLFLIVAWAIIWHYVKKTGYIKDSNE